VRRERSVRRLLLGWLLLPLATVLVASAVATYRTALRIASDAYDRALLDPALAIAQRLHVEGNEFELEMPAAALDALRVDESDRVYFSVIGRGRLVAGQGGLPLPPAEPMHAAPVFYDAMRRGEPVRIAAIAVPFPEGTVTAVPAHDDYNPVN